MRRGARARVYGRAEDALLGFHSVASSTKAFAFLARQLGQPLIACGPSGTADIAFSSKGGTQTRDNTGAAGKALREVPTSCRAT